LLKFISSLQSESSIHILFGKLSWRTKDNRLRLLLIPVCKTSIEPKGSFKNEVQLLEGVSDEVWRCVTIPCKRKILWKRGILKISFFMDVMNEWLNVIAGTLLHCPRLESARENTHRNFYKLLGTEQWWRN